ncbi:MAG TPA: heme oxygenase [Cryomorphaceae bacterium]|nr:heme oxygenase [Cryomorphaceae bacterium]
MKIDNVKSHIETVRQELIDHEAFLWVNNLEKVRVFMESHVWAVWDFMVLLKGLQRQLTCVDTYWVPNGNPEVRRLINEIVFGEESDIDQNGNAVSHFELYVQAMAEAGANITPILTFIEDLKKGADPKLALRQSEAPEGAKKFVLSTLEIVERGSTSEMAAVFTFGREDLIPDMFIEIVRNLKEKFPTELGLFTYYLERHIEVDGDVHGALAERMVTELCAEDESEWNQATVSSEKALGHRIELWTSVIKRYEALHSAQEIL